jgi:hypothetical protein
MKQILKTLTLAALLMGGAALTQNSSMTTVYEAEVVQRMPKPILIDPSSHAIIRFYERVDFAFSRRSDKLKAVFGGDKTSLPPTDLVLYVLDPKLETDLSVLVDGKWHFFTLKVAKGAGVRLYEIQRRNPEDGSATPAATPTPKPLSQKPVASISQPDAKPVTTPVSSQPAAQSISKPSTERTLAVLDKLKLEIVPIGSSNGELRFSFSLENNGPKRLFVDPLRLKILRGTIEIKAEAQSSDGRLILEPGKVMVGIIRLPEGQGPLKLEWRVRAFGMTSEVLLTAVIP